MALRSSYNNMLATTVAASTEATVRAIAARHGVTRSVVNRRLIETALTTPALLKTIRNALHDPERIRRPASKHIVASTVCNDDTFEQVKQLRNGNDATLVAVVRIVLDEAVKAVSSLDGLSRQLTGDACKAAEAQARSAARRAVQAKNGGVAA